MASHGVTLGVTKGVKKGVKLKLIASLHLVIPAAFVDIQKDNPKCEQESSLSLNVCKKKIDYSIGFFERRGTKFFLFFA